MTKLAKPKKNNHLSWLFRYQTMDGGKSWESLNHSGIFHAGIDRRGNLFTAAMEGAFVSRSELNRPPSRSLGKGWACRVAVWGKDGHAVSQF